MSAAQQEEKMLKIEDLLDFNFVDVNTIPCNTDVLRKEAKKEGRWTIFESERYLQVLK